MSRQIDKFPVEVEIAGAEAEERAFQVLSDLLTLAWLCSDPSLSIASTIYPPTSREELEKHGE